MSRQRIIQAVKPRSEIQLASTSSYLRIRCHDGSGTTIAATRSIKGVVEELSFQVQGTTTGIWSSPFDGFFTAQGDNYAQIQGGFSEFVDMRNFSGTRLFFLLLQEVATSQPTYITFGRPYNTAVGGIALQANNSSAPQLAITWQGNNAAVTAVGEFTQAGVPRAYMGSIVKSGSDLIISMFADGIQAGSNAVAANLMEIDPFYVNAGYDQDWCNLFARPNWNYSTPSVYMQAGLKIADIVVIRTDSDLTDDLQTIAAEYAKYPREFLTWGLNGV